MAIEIIQWQEDRGQDLVYRFPANEEIKMGAQLVVRENQAALFINEGKAADLFGPGRYQLTTQNIPILPVHAKCTAAHGDFGRRDHTA